jgi:hypothetical protein
MTGATSSSSTDLIRAVFREVIVPAATASPRCRLQFAPKVKNGSFFAPPRRSILSRAELEETGSMDEFATLAALWRSEGCDELVACVPRLAEIAERLAAEHGAEDRTAKTPSHLIYQMY